MTDCRYSLALSYVDEDFMMQLEGRHLNSAQAIKIPIHLNMAACQLREQDPQTAAFNCSEVIGGSLCVFSLLKGLHSQETSSSFRLHDFAGVTLFLLQMNLLL